MKKVISVLILIVMVFICLLLNYYLNEDTLDSFILEEKIEKYDKCEVCYHGLAFDPGGESDPGVGSNCICGEN